MRNLLLPLKIWASNPGNKVERADVEIAEGWHLGEPPRYDEWNFQENARDIRINENSLAISALGTAPGGLTPTDLCSEYPRTQTASPMLPPNYYALGNSVRDTCFGWDPTNKRPVLWLLDGANAIRPLTGCWETDTSPTVGSDLAISTPVAYNYILSICCDGGYLYAAWQRLSDSRIMVSRYTANNATFNTSPDWTYETPQTFNPAYGVRSMRLIIADSFRLCLFMADTTTPTEPVSVGLLTKDGATYTAGAGNATSVLGPITRSELMHVTTDGDHVFWLLAETSGSDRITYLASAAIASPTTSSYTFSTVSTIATTDYVSQPKNLFAQQDCVRIVSQSGDVYVFDQSTDTVAPAIAVTPTYSRTGAVFAASVGWDGRNLWIASPTRNVDDSSDTNVTLYRVPAGLVGPYSRRSTLGFEYPATRIEVLDPTAYGSAPIGDFRFDGRDLWWISAGASGGIFRITNPGIR